MNKIRKEGIGKLVNSRKLPKYMVAPELIQGPGVLPNRGGKHK
jgi:hypothetical protein